ncbi:hypothetical protein [uncultured Kordia sp.]|uniref:hypothetical protein n=1 Tax=uncultured Kordia sp. TaxID=507699 RepID=UPI0026372DE5|nr:hypothetical protein [uncultured Kordia sp.]
MKKALQLIVVFVAVIICVSFIEFEDSNYNFKEELKKFATEIVTKKREPIKDRIDFPLDVYAADAFGIQIPNTVKQFDFTVEMFDKGFDHFFRQEFIDSIKSEIKIVKQENRQFYLDYKSHNDDYKEHNMKGTCNHKIYCIYENGKIKITGFSMNCYGEG